MGFLRNIVNDARRPPAAEAPLAGVVYSGNDAFSEEASWREVQAEGSSPRVHAPAVPSGVDAPSETRVAGEPDVEFARTTEAIETQGDGIFRKEEPPPMPERIAAEDVAESSSEVNLSMRARGGPTAPPAAAAADAGATARPLQPDAVGAVPIAPGHGALPSSGVVQRAAVGAALSDRPLQRAAIAPLPGQSGPARPLPVTTVPAQQGSLPLRSARAVTPGDDVQPDRHATAAATPEAARAGSGAVEGAAPSRPAPAPVAAAGAAPPPAVPSPTSARLLPEPALAPPRPEPPAAPPRAEPAPTPPRVHIGRLEVVVLSDAPAPSPVQAERHDALASRLYLRGL